MKLLLTAIALMMLSACASDDNPVVNNTTSDGAVMTTGDVTVDDTQVEVADTDATDTVDSSEDVTTVEEGD